MSDTRGAYQPDLLDARLGPAVVVAGFDGSGGGANALAYAAGLAERARATLVVVWVDPLASPDGMPPPRTGIDLVAAEIEAAIGGSRCRVEIVVCGGDPATVIEDTAASVRADVVVVGRARRRLAHPLGSVPARLVRRANRPVLVVP